ncbi:MAG: hypothetical protein ACXWI8_11875, partial [Burkholderiales bacterium]
MSKLDVRLADHTRPFGNFGRQVIDKTLRGSTDRVGAERGNTLEHFGLVSARASSTFSLFSRGSTVRAGASMPHHVVA